MKNIAITIRSFNPAGPAMELLKKKYCISYMNTTGRHLSENELIAAIHDAHGVIAGTEKFTEKVFLASSGLQTISRVGIGLDSIDLDMAKKRNVRIFSTPESPVQAVAEHTIGLILSVLKNIPAYNCAMRQGAVSLIPGTLLSGKKAGIVGLGRIGSRVGFLLDSLGCSITYYDPFLTRVPPGHWQKSETLLDLVRTCDILTLHAASSASQKPLIDEKIVSECKKGVILINCARGSLIDESALIHGLETGTITAAGLDVFNKEPYQGPLLTYPQVIMTPHVASNTLESRLAMEMESVENLDRFFMENNL